MMIKVKVKPGSGKQEVVKVGDGRFIVSLKERAENGRANLELIKVLKRYFNNDKCVVEDLKLIKGLKSRNKVMMVIKNGDKI